MPLLLIGILAVSGGCGIVEVTSNTEEEASELGLLPDCGYTMLEFKCYIYKDDDVIQSSSTDISSEGCTEVTTCDNNGSEVVITSKKAGFFFLSEERVVVNQGRLLQEFSEQMLCLGKMPLVICRRIYR